MARPLGGTGQRETARIDVLLTLDLMSASIKAIRRTVRDQGLAEIAAKKQKA